MRWVVLLADDANGGGVDTTVYGSWHSYEAAEAFADRVNRRIRAHEDDESPDQGQVYATVCGVRPALMRTIAGEFGEGRF